MITRAICKFILRIWGWKVEKDVPEIDKYVIVGAPHTSNYDFILTMIFFLSKGIKISFFIKKEWFRFPFVKLFNALGGIAVDRDKKNRLIDQMVDLFNSNKRLFLIITPEGTRRKVSHWKRGFYYIAKASNVPIVLAYLDYKYKKLGVGPVFYASDDVEADILKTKQFYKNINPKFPEKFATGLD